MPSDMRITGALSSAASSDVTGGVHSAGSEAVPSEALVQTTPSPPHPIPNPTLELDPALGLVVIQFRNANGAITSSIPSQQQIDAYRLWQETKIGPRPNIEGGVATPTSASGADPNGGDQTAVGQAGIVQDPGAQVLSGGPTFSGSTVAFPQARGTDVSGETAAPQPSDATLPPKPG